MASRSQPEYGGDAMGTAPWVLLLISETASPSRTLLTQLRQALRATEPLARVVVRTESTRRGACLYRLQGHWTRPMEAHTALVMILSGLQNVEQHVPPR